MRNKLDLIVLAMTIFQVIYGVICLITNHPVSSVSFILVAVYGVICSLENVLEVVTHD